MASPGNRHCASCIGSLSFPMGYLIVDTVAQEQYAVKIVYPCGILLWSVAVSTIERHCSRLAAFFHAEEGPNRLTPIEVNLENRGASAVCLLDQHETCLSMYLLAVCRAVTAAVRWWYISSSRRTAVFSTPMIDCATLSTTENRCPLTHTRDP